MHGGQHVLADRSVSMSRVNWTACVGQAVGERLKWFLADRCNIAHDGTGLLPGEGGGDGEEELEAPEACAAPCIIMIALACLVFSLLVSGVVYCICRSVRAAFTRLQRRALFNASLDVTLKLTPALFNVSLDVTRKLTPALFNASLDVTQKITPALFNPFTAMLAVPSPGKRRRKVSNLKPLRCCRFLLPLRMSTRKDFYQNTQC